MPSRPDPELAPLLKSMAALTAALAQAQDRRRFKAALRSALRLPADASDARILERARALMELSRRD